MLLSHYVLSDSVWPHGLQQVRLLCLPPSPRVCSNSCPLSQWCHPTNSSSVIPFSFCLQSFPESGSLQMNQLFPSGGQSFGASASASVIPMNTQDWFLLGLTGSISQEPSPAPQFKSINSLALNFLYSLTLTSVHDYWTNHSFDYTEFCWQGNISAFKYVYIFFITFLSMRNHLLILWLQSSSAVNSEPRNIKFVTASTYPNSICSEVMELIAMIIFFWMLSFKPVFFSLIYHPHERVL